MKSIPLDLNKTTGPYLRPLYNLRIRGKEVIKEPSFPSRIFVVGGGGNGGYLVPWLARYISQSNSRMVREMEIVVIDGDKVEEKNIIRQNFTADEVGEYKATALADRCNRNLGTNVMAVNEFFTEGTMQELRRHNHIIFGCIDRHEVRKLLCDNIRGNNRCLSYIDVGNELSAGQLFISARVKEEDNDANHQRVERVTHYPLVMDEVYPEIAKADVKKAAPSCDEATASGIQRMSVNLTASILAFRTFEAMISPDPILHYEIVFDHEKFKTSWVRDLKWGPDGRLAQKNT